MKSFNEQYIAQQAKKETKDIHTEQTQGGSAEELTRKIAAAYHGKSNAAMLRSILEEAEKSKRAGTLSNEEIENFYQSFSPMLNGMQKRALRSVVDKLKEI
jgi:hypothetical protein